MKINFFKDKFSNPVLVTLFKSKSVLFSIIIIFLMVFTAVFANYIAPEGYNNQQLPERFKPPSWKYPLGTDYLGRSIFSRIIWGSRIVIYIAVVCLTISTTIGVVFGLISGYIGGTVDTIIMRIADIMLAFPTILLGIAILAIFGAGLENAIIAVAVSGIAPYIRLVRGQVLSEREELYVESSKALGASWIYILFRHILRNILSPIVVQSAFTVANSVIMVASFGFIGIGANPPTPDWGAILYEMRPYLRIAPVNAIIPGIFIFCVVYAFNALGEALRYNLDPRRRKGLVQFKL